MRPHVAEHQQAGREGAERFFMGAPGQAVLDMIAANVPEAEGIVRVLNCWGFDLGRLVDALSCHRYGSSGPSIDFIALSEGFGRFWEMWGFAFSSSPPRGVTGPGT